MAKCIGHMALIGLLAGQAIVRAKDPEWVKIDDFESSGALGEWLLADPKNNTDPRIENPQVTEIRNEIHSGNHYLLKKPAAEGVIGNRKALSYRKLPMPVNVGETFTFYMRVSVEAFPNNHVFGLSNLGPKDINHQGYDAFEPSLRVTDKRESNGFKNDGALMVRKGNGYDRVHNSNEGRAASPLAIGTWYEIWVVVNNGKLIHGGQQYDVHVRGGEFPVRQQVYSNADFRMKRELPLVYFLANCNTGPKSGPYGNGGLRYDDLYMIKGKVLTAAPPVNQKKK